MPELNRPQISLRLKESLLESGLTQWEMAEVLEVSKRAIEDYVSPKIATIPWNRLEMWAQVTGTSKYWLLHGAEQRAEVDPARLEAVFERLDRLVGLMEAAQEEQPPDG